LSNGTGLDVVKQLYEAAEASTMAYTLCHVGGPTPA